MKFTWRTYLVALYRARRAANNHREMVLYLMNGGKPGPGVHRVALKEHKRWKYREHSHYLLKGRVGYEFGVWL